MDISYNEYFLSHTEIFFAVVVTASIIAKRHATDTVSAYCTTNRLSDVTQRG